MYSIFQQQKKIIRFIIKHEGNLWEDLYAFDKRIHSVFIVHIDAVVEKSVYLEETHINWFKHKEDICNAVMVW